jgi:hypothetical protein
MMMDHETTGGPADIDAMVAVSGMAHDPFVFFVESVRIRPRKRDARPQFARASSGSVQSHDRQGVVLLQYELVFAKRCTK